MNMSQSGNVELKISLVNVPESITPLKLRGYLRGEAQDIQNKAKEHSFVIIRLFMPERMLFAYTQKKLDVLLEDIVNKVPCIHRVELVTVKNALDAAQMMEESKIAKEDLGLMIEDAKAFEESIKDEDRTVH